MGRAPARGRPASGRGGRTEGRAVTTAVKCHRPPLRRRGRVSGRRRPRVRRGGPACRPWSSRPPSPRPAARCAGCRRRRSPLGPGGVEGGDLPGDVLGHVVVGSGDEADGRADRPHGGDERRGAGDVAGVEQAVGGGDGVEDDGHGARRVEVVVHAGREGGERGGVGLGVSGQVARAAGEGIDAGRAAARPPPAARAPTCTGER